MIVVRRYVALLVCWFRKYLELSLEGIPKEKISHVVSHIFIPPISNEEKILSNVNMVVSGQLEKRK